jgi:hypothetical protein
LVGNPIILYFLFRLSKFTRKSSFLAGLTAAQVSEFGFVFLFVASRGGDFEEGILSIFTIVALVTIFMSSYIITYNHEIYNFIRPIMRAIFGPDKYKSVHEIDDVYDVLVLGYHRLGWKICDALAEMKISFAVVDFNPVAIKKMEERNIPFFFGDATEVDFLQELPIEKAKMIISTLPRSDDQITMIKHIRLTNNKILIIANLSHLQFMDNLYESGADYIMIPHLLSGLWLADILRKNAWNRDTFKKLTEMQKKELKLKFTLAKRQNKE